MIPTGKRAHLHHWAHLVEELSVCVLTGGAAPSSPGKGKKQGISIPVIRMSDAVTEQKTHCRTSSACVSLNFSRSEDVYCDGT